MRALITGSGGFVGPYLACSLEKDQHQVTSFDLRQGKDVRDYETVRAAIEAAEPDWIFHLAAVSWPRESMSDPRRSLDVNLTGAINVLDAARHLGSHARILLAGTSEEYGYGGRPSGAVLDEDALCHPTTPYGVSKLAATTLGMVYAQRYGLPVVATRAFNHTGPGRQAVNAESAFARRIVAVERGQADSVAHGDLSSYRNFTNVADVVEAYRLAIDLEPGIFNVCSDETVSMRTIMDMLLASSEANVVLKQIPGLGTAEHEDFPRPTCDRLRDATGWEPAVPLTQTLRDLLDYWRSR